MLSWNSLGALFVPSWELLGLSWEPPRTFWGPPDPTRNRHKSGIKPCYQTIGFYATFMPLLGRSWGPLGAPLGTPEALLGVSWTSWGSPDPTRHRHKNGINPGSRTIRFYATFMPLFTPSWSPLGALLGPPGALFEASWDLSEASRTHPKPA